MKRCQWAQDNLMIDYHDKEWGRPLHNDRKLFEMLILEGAQAGLSWLTILKRRRTYRKAFANFKFTRKDIQRLLHDEGIIRNKLKIGSAINNAKQFIEIQKEFRTFDKYIWSFVKNKPIINKYKKISEIPATTSISDEMSKDLKKRGFNFVGSTICYAFMQSVGMVNDHMTDCFLSKNTN